MQIRVYGYIQKLINFYFTTSYRKPRPSVQIAGFVVV